MAEMREAADSSPRPLGLVPTMGAVHAGHIALMDRARLENATVVTSLFVNPTQFNDQADFEGYARDSERDLAKFAASGTDIAFTPSVEEVYPSGFSTRICMGAVAKRLEGAARPGHFVAWPQSCANSSRPYVRTARISARRTLSSAPSFGASMPTSTSALRSQSCRPFATRTG